MTPSELKAAQAKAAWFKSVRLALGYSQTDWGWLLGMTGDNCRSTVHGMENATLKKDGSLKYPIGITTERLAFMYERHDVPDEFLEGEEG